MKIILILFLILLLSSCSFFPFGMTQSKPASQSRIGFICIADVDRDSNCMKVDCDYAQNHCKEFGDRVLVNYATGMIYFYRLEPLTDLNKCRESALGGR